jgi:polyribonucleotide nucleotidyltransferase
VLVAAVDGESAAAAIRRIEALTAVPELGRIYTGKVVRITDFGAFVEFMPGQDGLVHISQLADYRVEKVEDVVKEGDEIMVMVIDIAGSGRVQLSRQAGLEGWSLEEARQNDRKLAGGSRDRPAAAIVATGASIVTAAIVGIVVAASHWPLERLPAMIRFASPSLAAPAILILTRRRHERGTVRVAQPLCPVVS